MIKKRCISFIFVAIMFCFLTGCSFGLPTDSENADKSNRVTFMHLTNYNTSLGKIDRFDDIDEQLYSTFCVLNTYDEFIYLKNNFNSNKHVFEKLVNVLDTIHYDKMYFENKSLIISPFLHSSDETNISLLDIQLDDTAKKIDITFQFESPESVDHDILVDYFVIEVNKQNFVDKDNYTKIIHGYNSLLNSSGSSCYRYKNEK